MVIETQTRAGNGTNTNRGTMNTHVKEDGDKGFTLVEILIAIVLIGILSAVAVVGISSLVSKGSTSACNATLDSSKAASAVYFASNTNTYPADFNALTSGAAPALTLPSGVTIATATTLKSGTSWTLTMTAGSATAAPTFACT